MAARPGMKARWKDPVYIAKRHEAAKLAWADGTRDKAAASERTKELWKDPKYREAHIKAVSTPELAAKRKAIWADPKYKARMLQVRRTQANVTDPAHRKRNSQAMTVKWADPDYRIKMIAARKDSYTPERAARTGAKLVGNIPWNKGKNKRTDARLANASERQKGRVPDYKKNRAWYVGPNGKIWMRSKWEVAYAEYLDKTGQEWKYEPRFFVVGSGKWTGVAYVPDFYLPATDYYIELKGRLSPDAKRKYAAFKKLYPDIKWKMLNCSALKKIGVLDIHGCAILKTANSGAPGN